MNLQEEEKEPPIGVTPKIIWYEQRARDLSRAIYEYISDGRFECAYSWSIELTEILRMRRDWIAQNTEKGTSILL